MELTSGQILEWINYQDNTHSASRAILLNAGKTYRSHKVAFENGYLSALRDIRQVIEEPSRAEQLWQALQDLGKG